MILGEPGIGKSTLLRCLLLDLLSPKPRFETCSFRWGQYLPIWVPFAMWTRLVSDSEIECSLPDVLTGWLRKVSAGEALINLVQQALNDSRLLLFVDGLDEWNDEKAAQTALTLLQQFVGARNVPAIVSSRPLGYMRIGGLSGDWKKARLAGLNMEQQRFLAECWFFHRSNALALHDEDPSSRTMRESRAKSEASELIQDLQHDARLSRLAEVPLLLNGFIALAFQKMHLPRSRFKAYEELTRLLLEEQPQRREKAAHVRVAAERIGQENRERALARLAWETHNAPGSDVLDKSNALNAIQDFCSTRLYKELGDALEIAEEMLTFGTKTIGIIVEKSTTEVGFLHRTFQELLTAKYLSNLPFDQQKSLVGEHFGSSQWHEVFLCLCHLNTREGEVDDIVSIVEEIELPVEMESARQIFLAEIAFGDLHCSIDTAVRLAKKSFDIIEMGTHKQSRKQLVEHALNGLESDVLYPIVQSRVQRWYPLRHSYRYSFYETISTWPANDVTRAILWHGLFDEDSNNQRAAAESLAKVFCQDPSLEKMLSDLLFKPSEPQLLPFVLHAFCLGWGDNNKIPALLSDIRFTQDVLLQSVAIIHRVKRGEHDTSDRNILMGLSYFERLDVWNWTSELARTLIMGWPRDPEIKQVSD